MLKVSDRVSIPEEELTFTASRSGGPGGQHVNKVSTRITLRFDVAGSPSLSPEDKELIMNRLGSRVGKDGVIRVVCGQTRSQWANRETAVERFVELLREALKEVAVRRKTRVSRTAKLRRIEAKKHRGILKRRRSKKVRTEDE